MGVGRVQLLERLVEFRKVRDWEQFHTPKNLAISISVESSELLAIFQWTREDEMDKRIAESRDRIEEEMADIYIYLLLMANDLGIDLDDVANRKLALNEVKYPVEKSRGSSRKYNEL